MGWIDRLRFWRKPIVPASNSFTNGVRRAGVVAGESHAVWQNDRVLAGPGVAKFVYQAEANGVLTVLDLVQDLATLHQEIAEVYAKYQGVDARHALIVASLCEARERLEEKERQDDASARREIKHALLTIDRMGMEEDALFSELESLKSEAVQRGLPKYFAILGVRRSDASLRRSQQDYLLSAYTEGACSALGVECEADRIGTETTVGVVDDFIEQLQGSSVGGGWCFDFTAHVRRREENDLYLASAALGNQ